MNLLEKTEESELNQIDLHAGSGNFLVEEAPGYREKNHRFMWFFPVPGEMEKA